MFQKIDVYVVLVLTNIIIGQLNTELYDGDNGIPKFCICENLETHFHLVLFDHWHAKEPLFGKKRKFRQEKSFSFADFHGGMKMLSEEWKASESDEPAVEMILQDMKAEIFAATLRKLEDSVDDEFFERFFQEMMAKMHKTAPKLKRKNYHFSLFDQTYFWP